MDTIFDEGNDCYNDCLYTPYSGFFYTSLEVDASPSQKFIWGNRYIWEFDEFLNELCKLYNCYWDVYENKLVIKPMVEKLNDAAIDLSDQYLLTCYEFDLTKKAAYGNYKYTADASDEDSNQCQILYNDIVDFNDKGNNPMLEGRLDKTLLFASTSFYGDSIGTNEVFEVIRTGSNAAYAFVALLTIVAASLIAGVFTITGGIVLGATILAVIVVVDQTSQTLRNRYSPLTSRYRGIVKMRGNGTASSPRVLRYDPSTELNAAKVVNKDISTIVINPNYNKNSVAYANQPFLSGIYQTVDKVFNYPLFFDANYYGNLFDTYHETTDNPMVVNIGHKLVTVTLNLCCYNMDVMGLSGDVQRIVGKIVKISDTENMLVTYVKASYKDMSIIIKGTIIYI
jgi:hypothetical protein